MASPVRTRSGPFDFAVRGLARALPRDVVRALDQLRRDASMVAGSLVGRRPSPFVERRPRARSNETPVIVPRSLRVTRVVRETEDAVTIHLDDPSDEPIAFAPGQFFTLCIPIDGTTHKRAYSACTSAADGGGTVGVTVKRVRGGLVSNHLVDRVREGDRLAVLGPSGSFVPAPGSGARTLVLVGGGSGVTPLLSIARTLLATEPETTILLLCGNRRERDILFVDALAALARAHEHRFFVRHVLEDPPPEWTGGVGRLTRDVTERELGAWSQWLTERVEWFVCGPEAMRVEVHAALRARGVEPRRIHEERFTQPHLRATAASDEPLAEQRLVVRVNGVEREGVVAPGRTLLEAGLAAHAPMPYSCTMGGCGACRVKLLSGDVEMEEPNCLGAAERAEGYVLTCVGRPRSAVVVEVPS